MSCVWQLNCDVFRVASNLLCGGLVSEKRCKFALWVIIDLLGVTSRAHRKGRTGLVAFFKSLFSYGESIFVYSHF